MNISKRRSPKITPEIAAKIKHLVGEEGYMQHDVAARFGVNQGRISEIMKGRIYSEVPPDSAPPENPQPELPF